MAPQAIGRFISVIMRDICRARNALLTIFSLTVPFILLEDRSASGRFSKSIIVFVFTASIVLPFRYVIWPRQLKCMPITCFWLRIFDYFSSRFTYFLSIFDSLLILVTAAPQSLNASLKKIWVKTWFRNIFYMSLGRFVKLFKRATFQSLDFLQKIFGSKLTFYLTVILMWFLEWQLL